MPRNHLNILIVTAAILFLFTGFKTKASGQVIEQLSGTANPMETIGKSTLYGMGTGILLGTAYSLASNHTSFADGLKWGFVAGTGGGFIVGVIYVLTRPNPGQSALLEIGKTRKVCLAWPMPQLQISRGKFTGAAINIIHIAF